VLEGAGLADPICCLAVAKGDAVVQPVPSQSSVADENGGVIPAKAIAAV